MKSLYIVDYWVGFPTSEYGGTITAIAKDDNECHDLLLSWRDDYAESFDDSNDLQFQPGFGDVDWS